MNAAPRRPARNALPPLRRVNRAHARRPSAALPTPPDDAFPSGCAMFPSTSGLFLDPRSADEPPRVPQEDIGLASPSDTYPQMTLAEKVREANHAVVHQWGRFLVGAVIAELFDRSAWGPLQQHAPRAISAMDLPTHFCISPADELLCPSDDPMRVIVVVSPAGVILDTGVFDMDGPLFYKGLVVDNHYAPA
ncbi:hypothetical protein H4R18_004203 [Coemansia javaensis]|uniref:Uncharacterized protein n=1 Tax=Coemansia javaensis TaxID=2761396 RepID=A0A9W8HCB7_9FUNG|nr:hypothetical protein H4R18_004203 [Coemansia javaensis]